MNKRVSWSWVLLVVSSVALVACSGDDSGEEPIAGTGGGASGVGGASGLGGAGGTGGASGTGGAGGAPASIPCGTATCTNLMLPFPLPIPLPAACCANEAMNQCGTMMAGGACMPPAPGDPNCPMVTSPLPIPLTSCCAPNGMCGLDASALGMACVDFDTVRSGPFGAFLPVPAATVCDPSLIDDAGVDEDAGT
jgi:hypothetical protein